MPLEPQFRKFEANWSSHVLDLDRRVVASAMNPPARWTAWKWNFGDGTSSAEQHPIHQYAKGADYTVTLEVEGRKVSRAREKFWQVAVK